MSVLLPEVHSALHEFYALPENERAELIGGKLYMLAAPSRLHQGLVGVLYAAILSHIGGNKGKCKVYPAPFDVRLFEDDSVIVEPDISVICHPERLTDRGCSGAPDWILEVTSPSTASGDYLRKLWLYKKAGVREYWIVDPEEQKTVTYLFGADETYHIYEFSDTIPVSVYPGFSIRISEML